MIKKCYKKNKVTSFALALLLVVLTVCSVSVKGSAASYSARLSAPSKTNKYYYSDINTFYKYGYGMPNCTCYAFGRAYELLQSKPKLSVDSAKYWYDYNKQNKFYSYGQTPKLGAIACWSYSSGGHVAVVEKITSTTITFSNSAWGGQEFYLTTADINAKNPGQSGWTFQGYIYIGDFDSQTNEDTIPTGQYRITSDDGVNIRQNAGTSYKILSSIPYNKIVDVTKTKYADGYKWGNVSYNGVTGWCVLDYADYLGNNSNPTQPPTQAPTQSLTQAPTQAPTQSATQSPTQVPTQSPTQAPSNGTVVGDSDILGDVDGNGTVNIIDTTLTQKYLAGLVLEDSLLLKNADYNLDGVVSITDTTDVQKLLVMIS